MAKCKVLTGSAVKWLVHQYRLVTDYYCRRRVIASNIHRGTLTTDELALAQWRSDTSCVMCVRTPCRQNT